VESRGFEGTAGAEHMVVAGEKHFCSGQALDHGGGEHSVFASAGSVGFEENLVRGNPAGGEEAAHGDGAGFGRTFLFASADDQGTEVA